MPWLRAKLRDQLVFARATAAGEFDVTGGSVEVRYKANDGRLYRARAANLVVADPTLLPDSTCGDAQAVENAAKAADQASAARKKVAAAAVGAQVLPAGALVAYTDGACSGNPGPAGVGVVLLDSAGKVSVELSEYLGQATNNVAELTAIQRAIEGAPAPETPLLIHTDSQYAIGVLTKGWKAKANTALVAEIRSLLATRPRAKLIYVPGHSGVPLNERADQLAREAVERRQTRQTRQTSAPG
jgi:ribonuclease HI